MTINPEKRGRTALTVALMMGATVLSKLLGLLRTVFMATPTARESRQTPSPRPYRIPVSFFDMLFSAVIVGCFIPVYNSFTDDKKRERGDFARIFINFILLLTGALSVVGIIFARPILAAAAPGLTQRPRSLR